jgi:hypothetical protein
MIDLSKIQIDQLVGEVANIGFGQGKYYHGEGNYYSPFFKMKLFSEITKEYKQLYKNQILPNLNAWQYLVHSNLLRLISTPLPSVLFASVLLKRNLVQKEFCLLLV